jgi:hypothetical protein
MKKFLLSLVLGFISFSASAQSLKVPAASPLQVTTQDFGLGTVKVEYSRPAVRGRVIFGNVVPYDKVWRTGANGTTKITFTQKVKWDSISIDPGTYGLYTIPGLDSWTVMLYKDLTLAGRTSEYDAQKEVVRTNIHVTNKKDSIQTFTIQFEEVMPTTMMMVLSWETTAIRIPITTNIDDEIMANIEQNVLKDNRPYYQAAMYYFDNGKDLRQALKWADLAVEQNPTAYWVMMLKAKIEYKLGESKDALKSAEKVKSLAEKSAPEYIPVVDAFIAEIKAK